MISYHNKGQCYHFKPVRIVPRKCVWCCYIAHSEHMVLQANLLNVIEAFAVLIFILLCHVCSLNKSTPSTSYILYAGASAFPDGDEDNIYGGMSMSLMNACPKWDISIFTARALQELTKNKSFLKHVFPLFYSVYLLYSFFFSLDFITDTIHWFNPWWRKHTSATIYIGVGILRRFSLQNQRKRFHKGSF